MDEIGSFTSFSKDTHTVTRKKILNTKMNVVMVRGETCARPVLIVQNCIIICRHHDQQFFVVADLILGLIPNQLFFTGL